MSWPPAGLASPQGQLPSSSLPISWQPTSLGNGLNTGGNALQDLTAQYVTEQNALRVPGVAAPSSFGSVAPTIAQDVTGATNPSMLSKLGAAGFESPLAGGLKGLAGKAGRGLGYAVAGNVLGQIATSAGAPSEVGGALQGAGTGAGVGSLFGTPGTVVGGVIGGSIGALKGPAQEYQAAVIYDKQADRFVKATKKLPDDVRKEFGKVAMQIHHADGSIYDKAVALRSLVDQMNNYGKKPKTQDTVAHFGGGGLNPELQARVDAQVRQGLSQQMAEAMQQYSSLAGQQGDPRAALAYEAAARATPLADRMDAQMAQQQALANQAQYLSGYQSGYGTGTAQGGGGGSATLTQILAGK